MIQCQLHECTAADYRAADTWRLWHCCNIFALFLPQSGAPGNLRHQTDEITSPTGSDSVWWTLQNGFSNLKNLKKWKSVFLPSINGAAERDPPLKRSRCRRDYLSDSWLLAPLPPPAALFLFDHWRLPAASASLGASACEHGGGAAAARRRAAPTSQWRRLERGEGGRGPGEEEEKEEEEEQEHLCRWETFFIIYWMESLKRTKGAFFCYTLSVARQLCAQEETHEQLSQLWTILTFFCQKCAANIYNLNIKIILKQL